MQYMEAVTASKMRESFVCEWASVSVSAFSSMYFAIKKVCSLWSTFNVSLIHCSFIRHHVSVDHCKIKSKKGPFSHVQLWTVQDLAVPCLIGMVHGHHVYLIPESQDPEMNIKEARDFFLKFWPAIDREPYVCITRLIHHGFVTTVVRHIHQPIGNIYLWKYCREQFAVWFYHAKNT